MVVVNIWHRYTSTSSTTMSLVVTLHFIAASNNFHICISHVQGTNNSIADALSCKQMTTFRTLTPQADTTMTLYPTCTPYYQVCRYIMGLPVLPHPRHASMSLPSTSTNDSVTSHTLTPTSHSTLPHRLCHSPHHQQVTLHSNHLHCSSQALPPSCWIQG